MAKPHKARLLTGTRTGFVAALLFALLMDLASAGIESFAAAPQVRRRPAAISVTSSPTRISAGGTAQFSVRTSKINFTADVIVNYTMGGTAVLGQDYSSGSPAGSITIPAGTNSATVSINALGSSTSISRVATLRLQSGTGYKISTPSRSSVTIMPAASASPTPTPTPVGTATPTPSPTATPALQEIWIAIRSDGLSGTGAQNDPYDGSTPERFDGVLSSLQPTSYLWIHLVGVGPFRTDASHSWHVGQGWIISGDGMYATTLQLCGDVAATHGATAIWSDPNLATNNVTIRDLTIDCNWPELSSSAAIGLGGEKLFTATAVTLYGSNNLLEGVRCINSYGSSANGKECFAMALVGPRNGDGTNDIMQDCRAELPQGTYGNPFALAGWLRGSTSYLLRNSKVIGSTAVGVNTGSQAGFTSGGVNLANVKDCEIDGNTFIDCEGAMHLDTGTVDGLRVTNNTVIRGWFGVFLVDPNPLKQNIVIDGNNFLIQNRPSSGGSYGITVGLGITTNLTITNNTISFDPSGNGMTQFYGIAATELTNATITNNTIGTPPPPPQWSFYNYATGVGVTLLNNRTPDGLPVPDLGN